MRTLIEPPLRDWSLAESDAAADRAALAKVISARARRLGTAALTQTDRIIATGHQAWLWHPGILAKDIAMRVGCDRLRAAPLHLVVDQDAHDALSLELPVEQGQRLSVRKLRLGSQTLAVPTGFQPAADAGQIRATLLATGDSRAKRVARVFEDMPACESLAEQLAVVLVRLMQPTAGALPIVMTSDLPVMPGYQAMVDAMLRDARACVTAYNKAVDQHPDAGIAKLLVGRDRVELPIWAVAQGQMRQRVFADLADSEPWLVFDSGEQIDPQQYKLLPKAVMLTAVMRRLVCDLFIHGTGGGVYDQITDAWWQTWRGETLASRAVATADLYLDFDVPVADAQQFARAQWYRKHLPHNVDRALKLDGELAAAKRDILAHMDDDRDKRRRKAAYRKLHQINRELVRQHPDALAAADEKLTRARVGLANARIARKRDWCFALYRDDQLAALRDAVAESVPIMTSARTGSRS